MVYPPTCSWLRKPDELPTYTLAPFTLPQRVAYRDQFSFPQESMMPVGGMSFGALAGITPQHTHPCYGSCTGCQSVSASCSRSRGSYISRLSVWLLRTSQMTVAFCWTLAVAHCGPIPMTCGNCLCHEHITNSVIGVSRPPVLDYGTTFHLDSGGRDLPLTLLDNLWKLIYLATEALSDSFEFIGAI